jgi:cysteinyl-tRNA synthetase
MKSLIQELLDGRHAYVAEGTEGKEVLFDVSSMPDYGALSGRKLEDQKAGARVTVDAHKKNPGDFVLWKESGFKEPGWKGEFRPDPQSGYDAEFTISSENASELGRNSRVITIYGRPGWHIECSAMSAAYLGYIFDIHGGGLDLIFPHHENEIAQSRCAFHTPAMANYWMHNGFLQIEGEKMSKSAGNFVTIRELEHQYPGDVLRLLMLTTHYKQPIDWTRDGLESARKELLSWSELVFDYFNPGEDLGSFVQEDIDEQLVDALADDLNTPLALMRLREMYRLVKGEKYPVEAFVAALQWIGIRNVNKPGFFHPGVDARLFESGPKLTQAQQRDIIAYRAAVANGFVETADRLLNTVSKAGFILQLNGAGVIFVGNRTSAGMADLESEFRKKVEEKIASRNAARKAKNFAESDRIRDELAAMGVVLHDTKDGTTWEIAR